MYIQQLQAEQYTIFVLQGDLPPPSLPEQNQWVSQRAAKYWTPQEIQIAASAGAKPPHLSDAEDPELAAAIAASLADGDGTTSQAPPSPAEVANQVSFSGAGQRLGDNNAGTDDELDADLAAAIALSRECEVPSDGADKADGDDMELRPLKKKTRIQHWHYNPNTNPHYDWSTLKEEPAVGGVKIQLQMPDGGKLTRRFSSDETVGDVIDYVMRVCHEGGKKVPRSRILLSNTYPRQELDSKGASLEEVGIVGSAVLHVAIRG